MRRHADLRDLAGDQHSSDPGLQAQWETELAIDTDDEKKLTHRAVWAIVGTSLFTLILILANVVH